MEKMELIERIRKTVISVVGHENFEMKDELTAAQVDGWDSLSHMMIISELEKSFDVRFKLKEINKLNNMGDLVELVRSKAEVK